MSSANMDFQYTLFDPKMTSKSLYMKRCGTCKQLKPISEFSKQTKAKDGLQSRCKECHNVAMVSWNVENRYGITYEVKLKMIEEQNGCCALCRQPFENEKATHVDHCHITGKIRDILCRNCNTALGSFGDSIQLLQRAMNYLLHHAKKNATTFISTKPNKSSQDDSEFGPLFAAGSGEDDDNVDHHCGADARVDTNHRTQEGGRNSLGTGE